MPWLPTGLGRRVCGRTPSQVTYQLCWSESLGLDDETVVRQLVQWRIYTRRRGLKLDLVILDERGGESSDQLRKELETGVARDMFGKAGGVFFLNADKVQTNEAVLLAAAARAVLGGDRGSLTEQIDRPATHETVPAPPFTQTAIATKPVAQRTRRPAGLSFWNGFGGFTRDGREYVIVIDGTSRRGPSLPPAPGRMCWPIRSLVA